MSDEIRVNRTHQSQRSDMGGMSEPKETMRESSSASGSKAPWYILGVVVVILLICAVLLRDKLFTKKGSGNTQSTMQASSGYQAVFLSNGQVYFGKISATSNDYVTLDDIYYLQVVQPPLQGSGQSAQAQQGQQPQISLVKLGNELHGPVDEMHISRTQILFYEDLKNDGNVVKAIQAYKANPAGTPAK